MKDSDLKIIFTRGSGPGGQHKNKVETCVVVTHLPSGISERCQDTRSQSKNLELAKDRIESRLDKLEVAKAQQAVNDLRIEALNRGVVRTYNFARNEVKDHRSKKKASLKKMLNGDLDLVY